MSSFSSKIFIGTSGWAYNQWEGLFYPPDLSSSNRLKFFSQHFLTTEVNYSFYRLPRLQTYKKWYAQTPDDFIFALKCSRFITHIKRLKQIKEPWRKFLSNAKNLKQKLGPILFQFPPNFKAKKENIGRLADFLEFLASDFSEDRFAFEFRHSSWCRAPIYELLEKHRAGWVIADSSQYPKEEKITSDFTYIRMHGPKALYASKYHSKELKDLSLKLKKWAQKGLVCFVYFNNDVGGLAIENARELCNLLGKS